MHKRPLTTTAIRKCMREKKKKRILKRYETNKHLAHTHTRGQRPEDAWRLDFEREKNRTKRITWNEKKKTEFNNQFATKEPLKRPE